MSDAFFVSFFVCFFVCLFVRFFVRFFIHFRMTEPTDPASAHTRASVDATAPAAAHRHIRSFAMRRGHVTEAQKRAFADVLPRVAVPYAAQPLDLAATFGRRAPCVLEIGFGMGDATARIAQARPDVDFLGVEVFAAGVGALCKRIDEMQLDNIRIVQHDAVEVVRDMLAPDLLAGVHIYFPDPWPKARHHKRRLVQPGFIAQLVTRIAPGGYLHCATDWQHYAEQMLAVLSAEPQLANAHERYAPGARNPLVARPTTKFHARGERLGHGVWDLVFVRQPTKG
ncbi:MAG: tRNA (guanosine(46)-N7)-methyltransferase TrmB [Burkholderiaceae bacterium]|nr:tRNA (guanosine(46)-N7)-methyltransferase TrmB [Burkholderiaceae bacterium]